jgi:hypothetical protein
MGYLLQQPSLKTSTSIIRILYLDIEKCQKEKQTRDNQTGFNSLLNPRLNNSGNKESYCNTY